MLSLIISHKFFSSRQTGSRRRPSGCSSTSTNSWYDKQKIRYIESYLTIKEEEPISLVFSYVSFKRCWSDFKNITFCQWIYFLYPLKLSPLMQQVNCVLCIVLQLLFECEIWSKFKSFWQGSKEENNVVITNKCNK